MKNDIHPTIKPVNMVCYLLGNKSNAVVLDTLGGEFGLESAT